MAYICETTCLTKRFNRHVLPGAQPAWGYHAEAEEAGAGEHHQALPGPGPSRRAAGLAAGGPRRSKDSRGALSLHAVSILSDVRCPPRDEKTNLSTAAG
eukprot:scaffold350554_cov44-Prasinocladus_malaysianus.AAC.1